MKQQSFLSKPLSAYYLLIGTTAALSALGLVMVLSASSIHSLEVNGTSYSIVLKQFISIVIAVPLGYLAAHLPMERWRWLGKFSLLGSVAILLLTQIPGIGQSVNGNRNWLGFGPVVIQPSEFAKFFMILWAGYMLSKREHTGHTRTNVLTLLVPGFVAVMILIMKGRDLGTTAVFGAILIGLLFVSGIALRAFGATSIVLLSLVVTAIVTVPNRMRRILVVFNPFAPEYYKLAGWQPAHSIMGLASGGLFGVGLGASRQKWGNLAEAHTDFIFAVIGEELGLLGTLCVLLLLAALIYSVFKIALRATDPMVRYTCAGIGLWIAIQTILNIGSATSVLPVVGVTLPLVSYGGSSLIALYIGLGFVLGSALRDPAIAPALKRARR